MSIFSRKHIYPIGVDLGSNSIKIAQLYLDNGKLDICDAAMILKPQELETGSGQWQRWAADQIKKTISSGHFKGVKVVAGIISDELYIDHIKIERVEDSKLEESVRENMKAKLPYDSTNAMLKYVAIPSSNPKELNIVVIAAERLKVERHLAILEEAKVEIAGMSVWPFAMSHAFTKFFARRESDKNKVALLLDVGHRHSDIVISRHEELFFARSVKHGLEDIKENGSCDILISEINACVRYFENTHKVDRISRLMFLSGASADQSVCRALASLGREMEIVAQVGDCLEAIRPNPTKKLSFERRGSKIDWSVAFGLSLTE